MTAIHPVLTYPRAVALGEVLVAVADGRHVRWSPEDTDLIYEGILRHVVVSPDNYAFQRHGEDVREGVIRITTTQGMDTTVPVETAVDLYQLTLMVFE